MSPKFVFLGIGCLGFALGLLSVVWPQRSIGLYQWMMERFNWKVVPIDLPREVRNTRVLGVALAALSLAIFYIAFVRF
ncbi:MAG: hypothetical protein A2351_08305 [Omnitrophica bacterium RIFOXYB12_FULL_50_7]|nr:MAG: hypothetical protein A2351_08305 [Omnitrophica bacterium RIFOXYB12_FULL_50_7]